MGEGFQVPRVEGARVRLRPVVPRDYEFLWRLEQDPVLGTLYRHRGVSVSVEEYPRTLWRSVLVQFVIEDSATSAALGHVCAYAPDFRHGYCYLATALVPPARGLGWPLEGVTVFLSYLFDVFPLRKVYADVLEFNVRSIDRVLRDYASEEGRLRAHEFHMGRYWDLITFAVYRDLWESLGGRLELLSRALSDHVAPGTPSPPGSLAQRLLASHLGMPVLPDEDASLTEDCGLDSLALLELVELLEAESPVHVDVGVFESLVTVRDLDHLLRSYRQSD